MTTDEPRERQAARVLLIDSDDRLLLMHHLRTDRGFVWVPPGGGLEPGESPEKAAVREIAEETTLVLDTLGPCVWIRRSRLPGEPVLHVEHFFVARVAAGVEISTDQNSDTAELAWLIGHRWWSLDEIQAAGDTLFAPRDLGELVAPIIGGIMPSEPIAIGL